MYLPITIDDNIETPMPLASYAAQDVHDPSVFLIMSKLILSCDTTSRRAAQVRYTCRCLNTASQDLHRCSLYSVMFESEVRMARCTFSGQSLHCKPSLRSEPSSRQVE